MWISKRSKAYAHDLRSLLEGSGLSDSKAFLRSFVKRINADGDKVVVPYGLSLPPERKRCEVAVLPIDIPTLAKGIRTKPSKGQLEDLLESFTF